VKTAKKFIVVLVTTGSRRNALEIARFLTQRKYAACINIVPNLLSIYRWKGRVESASEFLLIIKTRKTLVKAVQNAIRKIHDYETPEILTVGLGLGDPLYLKWLNQETRSQE